MVTVKDKFFRGRRLRRNETIRRLVRETHLQLDDFVYPMFVVEGNNARQPIPSMPGQYHWSVDTLLDECRRLVDLGVIAVLLFGIPEEKDSCGNSAMVMHGPVQQACLAFEASAAKPLCHHRRVPV